LLFILKTIKKPIKIIYGQSAELVNFGTVGTYKILTTGPRKVTAEITSADLMRMQFATLWHH